MECMKAVDLKVLVKDLGLQGYFKMKKAELITFLQNNLQPTPAPCTRPTRPPPPLLTWEPRPLPLVRFKPGQNMLGLGQDKNMMPSSQEINIFEQQEMSKSRYK